MANATLIADSTTNVSGDIACFRDLEEPKSIETTEIPSRKFQIAAMAFEACKGAHRRTSADDAGTVERVYRGFK
jgi:hypothetical protein